MEKLSGATHTYPCGNYAAKIPAGIEDGRDLTPLHRLASSYIKIG
jgi:hypothetical protein